MDEQKFSTSQITPAANASGVTPPTDLAQPVSSYSSESSNYPIETLEVREPGAVVQTPHPTPSTMHSVPFSKRRAAIVSIAITLFITLLTGASMLAITRRNPGLLESTANITPSQELKVNKPSEAFGASEFTNQQESLLARGDIITRGSLKVSTGEFTAVLRPEVLTANRNLNLPDASGTICLDSNNCGFATSAQLAQIAGRETPPSVTLNGRAGSITLQGTSNQVAVTTDGNIITLSTPQDLATGSSPNFSSLNLGAGLTVGGIVTLPLNCATFVNGGTLTTNTAGQIICDDDEVSGAGTSVTSVGGSTNRIPIFTSAQAIADSWLAQNGSTLELDNTRNLSLLGGNLSVSGSVVAGTYNGQTISSTAGFTGSVGIAGLTTLSGGLTIEVGDTFTFNGEALTDLTGEGLQVSGTALTLALEANKGLEVNVDGLSLIDCANGEILKYNGSNQWGCAADAGGTGVGDSITVNGTAATEANFLNTAASSTVASTTWSLNASSSPDDISIAIGAASGSDAGILTAGAQTLGGAKTFSGQITAGAGINLGTQTLQGTTAVINFDNFDVSSTGAVTAVGVNAGSGLIQGTGGITVAGTVTLSSLTNGFLEVNGSGVVSVGTIDLGTDTNGNYVATITSGNGISASATGEGSTPTIALSNLTADWLQSGAFDITLDNASSELKIRESSGAFYAIFDVSDIAADQTFMLSEGGTVVTTGNVASHATTAVTAGSGLTGGGTVGSLTLNIGAGNGITVNANDITLTLQANKGLEVDSNGLSLIDCSTDGHVLKYNTTTNQWGCAADAGAGGLGDDVSVNGTGANGANFTDVTATGSVAGTAWSLGTGANPNTISLGISTASDTLAGIVTTGGQDFAGTKTFRNGLTVTAGQNLTVNSDVFTDLTGNGLEVSGSALSLKLRPNQGLVVDSSGIGLIDTCADGELLKYETTGNTWVCASDTDTDTNTDTGDEVLANGTALAGANFVNVTATGTLVGVTWTADNTPDPDTISLALGAASDTTAGIITTGAQTLAGAKTFNGAATFNGNLSVETGDTFTINGDGFTDLTGTGLQISGGTLQTTLGTSIQDSEVDNNITVDSSGSVDWLALNNYPAACAAGSAVSTLADTPTCTSFAPVSGSGNYIQNGTIQNNASYNIQASGTTTVTAKLRVNTGQTADVLQVRDATDANTLFSVSPTGAVTTSGYNQTSGSFSVQSTSLNLHTTSSGGISIGTAAGSGAISLGTGTNTFALNSDAFDVSSAGALSGMTGYNQSAGSFSVQSTSVNLHTSSNGTISIGTSPGSGAISLGQGTNTFALNSDAFDVSSAGALSGMTGYNQSAGSFSVQSTSVNLHTTASGTISIGTTAGSGAITMGNGSDFSLNSSAFDVSTAGVLSGMTGYSQTSGSFNVSGSSGINLQTTGSAAISIGTMVGSGAISLGLGTNTFALNSDTFDVSTAGAASGLTGIASSGNIDFSALNAGGIVRAAAGSGRLSVAVAGTDYENPLTFSNGLTRTGNAVVLGGALTANTTLQAGNSYNLAVTSDLSTGARSTYAMTISQGSSVTNNNSTGLLQLTNSDSGSTAALLNVNQAGTGTGISVTNAGVGINIDTANNTGINFTNLTTGTALNIASNGSSMIGLAYTPDVGFSTGSALRVAGSASGALSNLAGNLIDIVPLRTHTGATNIADTGSYLRIDRSNEINSTGQTYTISGDLAKLSSTCVQTAGTCTDTSNILELSQQYANSTGAVLNILGAGSGNLAVLDATSASANGVSIDVQSSSSSQYAFQVTSNNGATTGLYVRADGNVGIGTPTPNRKLEVKDNTTGAGAASLRIDNSGTAGNEVGLEFYTSTASATGTFRTGRIYGVWSNTNYSGSRLTFQSMANGNILTDTLSLQNGNAGFGDTSPAYLLTVGNGDMFGIQSDGSHIWEGATADAFETTLTVVDPTADVTYRLATADAGTYDICTTHGNCNGNATTTLQQAYGNDSDGLSTIISLTSADDSIIFRNATDAGGSDSDEVITIEQLAVGSAKGGLVITSAGGSSGYALRVNDDAVDVSPFVVTNSGNVGIGTTTADYKLDVRSSTSASQLHVVNSDADTGGWLTSTGSDLYLSGQAAYNGVNWIAKGTSAAIASLNNNAGSFSIYTNGSLTSGNSFTPTERFRINSSGAVFLYNYDCTTSANGGALTVDASNQVICSNDESTGGVFTLQSAYDNSTPVSGYTQIQQTATDRGIKILGFNQTAANTAADEVLNVLGGNGGGSSTSTAAGAGSGMTLQGGIGGDSSSSGAGGVGGSLTLKGGNGGTSVSGVKGNGGDVNLSGGIRGTAGLGGSPRDGYVLLQAANAGLVGIGTSAPTAVLHVVAESITDPAIKGSSNAEAVLRVVGGSGAPNASSTGGTGSLISLATGSGGSGGGVSGSGGSGGSLSITTGAGGNAAGGGNGGSGGAITIQGGAGGTGAGGSGSYGNITLQASGGNVMIGGSGGPSYKLHVKNDANGHTVSAVENTANISGTDTAARASFVARNGTGANEVDAALFGATGTAFTTSGVLLQDSAYIQAGANLSNGLNIITDGTGTGAAIRFATSGSANERMRITNTGVVGINADTPHSIVKLDVINATGGGSPVGISQIRVGHNDSLSSGGFLTSRDHNSVALSANSYFDGANWQRVAASVNATILEIDEGELSFSSDDGPSGVVTRVKKLKVNAGGGLYLGDVDGMGTPGAIHGKFTGASVTNVIESATSTGIVSFGARNDGGGNTSEISVGSTGSAYTTGTAAFPASAAFLASQSNLSSGLSVVALSTNANAHIKFFTGGQAAGNERLRIAKDGLVSVLGATGGLCIKEGATCPSTTDSSLFIEDRLILGKDPRTIASNGFPAVRATLTLNPTASYVEITCDDVDGCDITMSEASPVTAGQTVMIVNVGAANSVHFADTGGITEIANAFAAGRWSTLTLIYATNTWVEISRSSN